MFPQRRLKSFLQKKEKRKEKTTTHTIIFNESKDKNGNEEEEDEEKAERKKNENKIESGSVKVCGFSEEYLIAYIKLCSSIKIKLAYKKHTEWKSYKFHTEWKF